MKKNNKYWKDYYHKNNDYQLINSQLDRMRYYLNKPIISSSIKILKENINKINFLGDYCSWKKLKRIFIVKKKKKFFKF